MRWGGVEVVSLENDTVYLWCEMANHFLFEMPNESVRVYGLCDNVCLLARACAYSLYRSHHMNTYKTSTQEPRKNANQNNHWIDGEVHFTHTHTRTHTHTHNKFICWCDKVTCAFYIIRFIVFVFEVSFWFGFGDLRSHEYTHTHTHKLQSLTSHQPLSFTNRKCSWWVLTILCLLIALFVFLVNRTKPKKSSRLFVISHKIDIQIVML